MGYPISGKPPVASDLYGWVDYIQPFSSARGRGTSEPTWTDMGNGHFAYQFTVGEELFVPEHIRHNYKKGTKAYPHVHFCSDQTMSAGDQITWRYGYVKAKGHSQGESMTVPETSFDMTYTATGNEIAGEHIILECTEAQAFDLLEPDTYLSGRFELIGTNTAGRIFAQFGDLHVETDRDGTPGKAPDFYS